MGVNLLVKIYHELCRMGEFDGGKFTWGKSKLTIWNLITSCQASIKFFNSFMTEAVICSASQWTGFYMITASVMKELNLTNNRNE